MVAQAVLGYGEGWACAVHARVFEPDALPHSSAPGAEPVVLLTEFGDHTGITITNSIEDAAGAAQERFYPDGDLVRMVLMYPHTRYCASTPSAPLSLREVTFAERYRRTRFSRWMDERHRRRRLRRGSWQFAVTSVAADGVTRHVLPDCTPECRDWSFAYPRFGKELALELPDHERDAVVGTGTDRTADRCADPLRFTRPTAVRVPALLGETLLPAWPVEQYTAATVMGPHAGAYAAGLRAAVERRSATTMAAVRAFTDSESGTIDEIGAVHTSGRSSVQGRRP